ncbi:MAG: phosphoribosylanthranilate isomerase [Bryobacterales bacterium]|nr:phosphoribosylanthranilate isomerase [Bryobacterales bacterium]
MSVLVKICGITKLEDALASVEAGAGAVGFNFYGKSPRYVTPALAARIARALPASVRKVGVFVNATPAEVEAIRGEVGLDVVQLHGAEDPAAYLALAPLWRAVRVDGGFVPQEIPEWPVEAILLDGPAGTLYGGAGIPFDWKAARVLPMPVVVAGGLDPTNVAEALRLAQPWGVDACSRLETAPGIKDHKKIRAFLDAVRSAGGLS